MFPEKWSSRSAAATRSRREFRGRAPDGRGRAGPGRWQGRRASFETTPIAAASIAQVHAARLRTGEEVVVKVQRPDVAGLVRRDLAAMSFIAPPSSGGSRWRRWPTRRRWSRCSPRRSSRSSTSASRPTTCSTSAAVLAETNQRSIIVPRPHPRLVDAPDARDGAARRLRMGRRRGECRPGSTRRRAQGRDGLLSWRAPCCTGSSTATCTEATSSSRATAASPCSTTASPGRLGEQQRLAFLELLIGGTTKSIPIQVEALKELGALPADADVEQVIKGPRARQAALDVITLSADELIVSSAISPSSSGVRGEDAEGADVVVKDLLFLDGAVATLPRDRPSRGGGPHRDLLRRPLR